MLIMLCGPITGDFKADWQLFKKYEDEFSYRNIYVVNPLRLIKERRKDEDAFIRMVEMKVSDESWRWMCDLRILIDGLLFVDAVFLFPEWNINSNSIMVAMAAQAMNLKLVYFDEDGVLKRRAISIITESESPFEGKNLVSFNKNEARDKNLPAIPDNLEMPEDYQLEAEDNGPINRIQDFKDSMAKAKLDQVGDWLNSQLSGEFRRRRTKKRPRDKF